MVDQENFRLCQEVEIKVVPHELIFHRPARTSRDVLKTRRVFYLVLQSKADHVFGIGEAAPISGLSDESVDSVLDALQQIASKELTLEQFQTLLAKHSSVKFAVETACLDFRHGGKRILFEDNFLHPVVINGLVWMNEIDTMFEEAKQKVESGFTTIKFKVGALNFDDELKMLSDFRNLFPEIEIRLDANGAFLPGDAKKKLNVLSPLNIHSIEQPIAKGNWKWLSEVCQYSPIPIALDEELIGIHDHAAKRELLQTVRPDYIILKPSLHGGLSGCDEWISLARELKVRWWATSALESSVGLNAIAQWVMKYDVTLPQGLGTGSLFENNLPSPWYVEHGMLVPKSGEWDLNWLVGQI